MQQENIQPTKRFVTVKKAAELYAGIFTEASIRWLIFNEKKNNFSHCIRRIGRKLLLNLDQFETWIDEQGVQNEKSK